MTPTPDITPRWLKFPAAMRYASMGRHKLERLIEEGKVRAFWDGGLRKVDRLSIDKYYEDLMGKDRVKESVLDLKRRLGR